MDYETLLPELKTKLLDKKLELKAIGDFLANEQMTPEERKQIEAHSKQVWMELHRIKHEYDWYYAMAIESGKW